MNKLILFMFLYECIGFSYASEIRVFKYIAMAEAMASVGNVVEGVPDFWRLVTMKSAGRVL
jgi:hypothetical protein